MHYNFLTFNYFPFPLDGKDTESGHGTFVSGTAAGLIQTSDLITSLATDTGRFDGIAMNAKVQIYRNIYNIF
jgi:hypothetical protein